MLRLALTAVTTTGFPSYDEELMALLPDEIGRAPTVAWANAMLRERVPDELGMITWRYDEDDLPELRAALPGGRLFR